MPDQRPKVAPQAAKHRFRHAQAIAAHESKIRAIAEKPVIIQPRGRFVSGGDIAESMSCQILAESKSAAPKVKAFWHNGNYWTSSSSMTGAGNYRFDCWRMIAIDKPTGKRPERGHEGRTVTFKGTLYRLTDGHSFAAPELTEDEKRWELRSWFAHPGGYAPSKESYRAYLEFERDSVGKWKDFNAIWQLEWDAMEAKEIPSSQALMRAAITQYAPKPAKPVIVPIPTMPKPRSLKPSPLSEFTRTATDALQALLERFPG